MTDDNLPKDVWFNYTITRKASITHIHSMEEINGVLFVTHEIRDEKGLLEIHKIRADQVKG